MINPARIRGIARSIRLLHLGTGVQEALATELEQLAYELEDLEPEPTETIVINIYR